MTADMAGGMHERGRQQFVRLLSFPLQSGSLIEPLQYLDILTDYPPTTFDSNITRYHHAFFFWPTRWTTRYQLRVSLDVCFYDSVVGIIQPVLRYRATPHSDTAGQTLTAPTPLLGYIPIGEGSPEPISTPDSLPVDPTDGP